MRVHPTARLVGYLLLCGGLPAQTEPFPGPWTHPPAWPPPTGAVVRVSTEAALQHAVRRVESNTTILIAPGSYELSNTLHLRGGVHHVGLRGATGRREDVVLHGRGMRNEDYGNVPHGILVSDCTDVLIADLSVGDVWFHPITLQGHAGCKRVRVYNCRLFEAGEQFLKANPASPDGALGGVDDGVVEYCVFEYTDTARHWYTEGIDVHAGLNWVVRNNLFYNIRGPEGATNIGGAIDFWNRSRGTLVERNVIINCATGIRLGVLDRPGYEDHAGGIIRNNFIYRAADSCHWADVGIIVNDSPGTKVLHNTILFEDDYPNAIELRFPSARGLVVAGNLTNRKIRLRDGAQATQAHNLTQARPDWFVHPASGDLHLAPRTVEARDQVPVHPDCPDDFDGTARPDGPMADLGADEAS